MSLQDMFRKKGGADGVITSAGFSIKEWPAKKKGDDPYSTLSFDFLFQADGATEPGERFMNAGFVYEGTTVSDDGKTLESEDEGALIQEDSEFSRFIASLVEKGFPEETLDPTGRNFEVLEGVRLQLTQWVDKEATEKFGKRVAKKGPRKGQSFNRTETRCGLIYTTAAPPTGKKATKATAAPKAGKKGTKPATAPAVSDTEAADKAIVEMVAATKEGVLKISGMSSAVVRYSLQKENKDVDRTALSKQLKDEDYLNDAMAREVIVYDAEAKMISLVE